MKNTQQFIYLYCGVAFCKLGKPHERAFDVIDIVAIIKEHDII